MKTCNKCGTQKPLDEFNKDRAQKDGHKTTCKVCHRAASATYHALNKEKVNAKSAAWHAAHTDKAHARNAEWRAANYQQANARTAKWRAENPEKVRIHSHNRRARVNAAGKLSHGLAARLYELQRGTCACGCGQALGDTYHLDHIIPLALGGTNTDENIQLLRASCNRQKSAKHPVAFMQQRGFLL